MADPFALPGLGVRVRKKKPKAPSPTIGQRAMGALEYVGQKMSQATLYPLTNAMQALHKGKPLGKAVVSGFKGKDISGEGEAKGYGGVFEAAGADPKKMSTRIAAGTANVIADPINAFFPFGKTPAGIKAAKGLIPGAKNLGEAADLGHRALLTAKLPGMDPITIIKGAPALKSLSYVGQGISKLPAVKQINAAITGRTGHPIYDALKSGEYQRGNRTARLGAQEFGTSSAEKIAGISKATGKTPEELNRKLVDYITAPQRSDISGLKLPSMAKKLDKLNEKLPQLAKGAEREVNLRKTALPSHIEAINPAMAAKKMDELKKGFKAPTKGVGFTSSPEGAAKITRAKIDRLVEAKKTTTSFENIPKEKWPKELLVQEANVAKMAKSHGIQKEAYLKGVEGLTPEKATAQALSEMKAYSHQLKSLRGQKEAMMKSGMKTGSVDYEKLMTINKNIGDLSSKLKETLSSNVGKFAKASDQKARIQGALDSRHKMIQAATSTARGSIKADMPDELHKMAEEAIQLHDKMGKELVDFKPGTELLDGYLKQILTQDAKVILDKLPKGEQERKAFSTFIGAALHRNFKGKTINEWNEMAMSGNLIKGQSFKLFEDNVPLVMATSLWQHERMKNTVQFFRETGKLVGKTTDDYSTQLKAGMIKSSDYKLMNLPEWKSGKNPKGVLYVPTEVANDLTRMYKIANDPESIDAVSKTLNLINSWYKSYTLPLYPAYHVRNVVGNVMNNAYAGVINPEDYRDALQVLMKKNFKLKVQGEMWDTKRIMREANIHGVIDQGYYAKETGLHEGPMSLMKEMEPPVGYEKYLGPKSIPVEAGRKVGTFFENHARVTHFISKLKDGYTPTAAGASVNKYLFDYGDLGHVSKKLRMIFPFMTWFLKNTPLQIENLITKPGLVGGIERFRQGVSGSDRPDERYFSDYMTENFPAYIRTNKEGVHEYFLGGSWLPQADISRVFGTGRNMKEILAGTPKNVLQTVSGLLTPVLKEPISQAFNYDPYFGSEIQKFPGELQKLNYPGGQLQLPARLVHAAKQFMPIGEASNLFNPDIPMGKNITRTLTGLKTSPYNVEKSRARKIVEVRRELGKLKGLRNYYSKTNDQRNLKAVELQIDKLTAGVK